MAGMKAVQTQLSSVERSITKLERSVSELTVAMKAIEISPTQTAKNVGQLDTQSRAVKKLRDNYVELAAAESVANQRNFPGGVITAFSPGRDTRASGVLGYNNRGFLSGAAQAEATRLMSRTGIRTQSATALGAVATVISDAQRMTDLKNAADLKSAEKFSQGEFVYRRHLKTLLDSQKTATGAMIMGAAGGETGPFRRTIGTFGDFDEMAREADALTKRENRARAYLGKTGASTSFRELGGFLSGGSGRRGGGDGSVGGYFRNLYHGNYGEGGRGRYDVPGLNLLAGVLPGGRRARPAAVLSALGLGLAATPSAIPGAVGLGAAASAGLVALAGGALTLKLAFADLNAAAFTTQKGFNALNPVQQQFVSSMRAVDYGFVRPLEQLASSRVLPGLTAALRQAFTPGAKSAIQSGVSSFGGAISGGAQQFGKLFGSPQFSLQFGKMLQQDSILLRDMFKWLSNLADAFVHVSVAAGPFVQWLSNGTTAFTKWIDTSIRAGQATGTLATYFDKAKQSLQAWGDLVGSVGKLFQSIFNGIGFKNAISVVNLVSAVFQTLTGFINQNKSTIRAFSTALIKSFGDLNKSIRILLGTVTTLINQVRSILKPIQDATGGVISLRVAIDGLFLLMAVRSISKLALVASGIGGIGAAAGTSTAALWALRVAILAVIGLETFKLGEKLGNWLHGGDHNAGYGSKASLAALAQATSLYGPNVPVNQFGQPVDASGKLLPAPAVAALAARYQARYNAQVNTRAAAAVAAAGGSAGNALFKGSGGPSTAGGAGNAGNFSNIPPLLGTGKTGVLPSAMETLISRADAEQGMSQQIAQRQAAIAWVRAHVGGISNQTIKNTYYQEEAALKQQIASIKSAALTASGGKPSLLTQVFSAARQAAFSRAQSRFSSASASGSPALELQGVNQMLRVAGDQLKYLMGEQGTVTKGSKKWLEIVKEIKVMNDAITQGQKEQIRALKELHKEQQKALAAGLQLKWDRLLHIGAGVPPSALSLQHSERSMLLGLVRFLAPRSRGGRGVIHDPYAAIPGAGNMSVDQLIKSLQGHGVHFSKRALEDFATIRKILEESKKSGVKLSPDSTSVIRALLKQISDNTKHMASFPSTYRLPSVKQIMEGLHGGTPELRKQIAERLVALGPLHGKLPTGPTAFGYPTGAVVVHGDVHITVSGAHGDAARVAKNIRDELQKTARRNTTQTKGSNAGRNLGLG